MQDKEHYKKKIAHLETLNDQLQAEFQYLNKILKQLGFAQGIKTLKEAAQEILDNKED